MVQRVVDSEVKEILDTTIDTQPFIVAANLTVTERLADAGYSTDRLKEIERWLSAHLACQRDPREIDVRADGLGVSYERATSGEGLKSTRYGQQVCLLDYLGILAMDSRSVRAGFSVD